MRRKYLLVWVLLAPTMVGMTPAGEGDLAKFQGRWSAKAGPRKDIVVTLEIRGRRVKANITMPRGLKIEAEGEVRLDESASPRSLDWVGFNTSDGQEIPALQAIYRVEGETLIIRNGGFNDGRPTAFEPGDGSLAGVVVFERP